MQKMIHFKKFKSKLKINKLCSVDYTLWVPRQIVWGSQKR